MDKQRERPGWVDRIHCDEDAVAAIDQLKYALKSREAEQPAWIADALNAALNKIIVNFDLDGDPHEFARMPQPPSLSECFYCRALIYNAQHDECPRCGVEISTSSKVLQSSKVNNEGQVVAEGRLVWKEKEEEENG